MIMTTRLAWQFCIDKLIPHFGKNEAESLSRIVFEHFFKLDRVELAMGGNEPFSDKNMNILDDVLKKLKNGFPVQYLTNVAHFYSLEFFVDERVLIPRPETEELVKWIIDDALDTENSERLKILDIGTGSGCIAVTLAANLPEADLAACDVSEGALEVAKINATKNNVVVRFFNIDILSEKLPTDKYDVIVSNPPYVLDSEKDLMLPNVLNHEPHNALFVPTQEPLLFYEAITAKAFVSLKQKGILYLEINENLGKETITCLEKAGFVKTELKKDFRGKDRMIRADKG
jgi:release factor glutamine methyltransferase